MESEWKKFKIGELGKVITGKTPSTKKPENFNGPYPFIRIPDMGSSVYISKTERTLSNLGAEIMNSCVLPKDSVMMSCIATVGKCGITSQKSFTNQQINSVICDKKKVFPRFLYYVFTQLGNELHAAGGGGSVYTNVSKSRFSNIEIKIPDLQEQRKIAHILGSLDDKIELNREMNETLEGIARGIFKSWFIDFDPVIDNALRAGNPIPEPFAERADVRRQILKQKKSPSKYDSLFPDKFQNSELGWIPVGWEIRFLKEIAEVIDCLHSKKPKRQNYGKLLIQVFNIENHGIIEFSDPYYISKEDYELWISRMEIRTGDLVITKTGRVGAVGQMPHGYNAAMGRNMVGIRAKKRVSSPYYLKDLLISKRMKTEIIRNTNDGTILKSLHVKAINKLKVSISKYRIVKKYEETIKSFHKLQERNIEENYHLSSSKDAILPVLITGKYRLF